MNRGLPSILVSLLCATFALLICADAGTVIQIVDTVAPDLLPTLPSEASSPKYVVALQNGNAQSSGSEAVLPMKDKYGRPYSCSIPDTEESHISAQEERSSKDDQLSAQRAPSELLSALDSICLYRIEDWWTYELCYKKHVRQFHKEGDNAMSEYDLGQYDEGLSDLDTILDNGTLAGSSSKYVRQVYTGGKACDITGRQRETEVHYVCSAEGKEGIKSIREHATCQYTLVFATPRLCKHPGFHVAEQPVHTIVCSQQGGSQRGDDTEPAQQWAMVAEAEGDAPVAGSEGVSTEGGFKEISQNEQNEGAQEGAVDMPRALQAGIVNASALEGPFQSSGEDLQAEAGQIRAGNGDEGRETGREVEQNKPHGAGDAEEWQDSKRRAPKAPGAVGPPSVADTKPPGGHAYYEDAGDDEEADLKSVGEDDDELDFSRTGMHAEL